MLNWFIVASHHVPEFVSRSIECPHPHGFPGNASRTI
jgi:hypothetical protein